jgi:hypothetical protein
MLPPPAPPTVTTLKIFEEQIKLLKKKSFDNCLKFLTILYNNINKTISVINYKYSIKYLQAFHNNFIPTYFTTQNTDNINDIIDNTLPIMKDLPHDIDSLMTLKQNSVNDTRETLIKKYFLHLTNIYNLNLVNMINPISAVVEGYITSGVPNALIPSTILPKGEFGNKHQFQDNKSDKLLPIGGTLLDKQLQIIKYDLIKFSLDKVYVLLTTPDDTKLSESIKKISEEIKTLVTDNNNSITLSLIANTIDKILIEYFKKLIMNSSIKIINERFSPTISGGNIEYNEQKLKYSLIKKPLIKNLSIDLPMTDTNVHRIIIPNFNSSESQINCFNINPSVTTLLLDNGADIEARDLNGNTPIYMAVDIGHMEILKTLIDRNAIIHNTDYVNNNGQSVLQYAYDHYYEYLTLKNYGIKQISNRFTLPILKKIKEKYKNNIIRNSDIFIQISLYLVNHLLYQLHISNFNAWNLDSQAKLNKVLEIERNDVIPLIQVNIDEIIDDLNRRKNNLKDQINKLLKQLVTLENDNSELIKEKMNINVKKKLYENNKNIEEIKQQIISSKQKLKNIMSQDEYEIYKFDYSIEKLNQANENIAKHLSIGTLSRELEDAKFINDATITKLQLAKTQILKPPKSYDNSKNLISIVKGNTDSNLSYPIIKTYNDIAINIRGDEKNLNTKLYPKLWRKLLSDENPKNTYPLIMDNIMKKQEEIFRKRKDDENDINNIIETKSLEMKIFDDFNTIVLTKFINDYFFMPQNLTENSSLTFIFDIIKHVTTYMILPKFYEIILLIMNDYTKETTGIESENKIFKIIKYFNEMSDKYIKNTLNIFLNSEEQHYDTKELLNKIITILINQSDIILDEQSQLISNIRTFVIPYFEEYLNEYIIGMKKTIDDYFKLLLYQKKNLKVIMLLVNKFL